MPSRPGRGEEGATLVEFALIVPLFILLLFATIDFGLAFGGWTAFRSDVQTSTRLAGLDYYKCQDANCLVTDLQNSIGATTGTTGSVEVEFVCSGSMCTAGTTTSTLTVCARIRGHSETGLLTPILDQVWLSSTSEIVLDQSLGLNDRQTQSLGYGYACGT